MALVVAAAPAAAQIAATATTPDPGEQAVGDAEAALPGVARVAVATPMRRGAAVSAFAGYGFTGAVLDLGDTHHRAAGQFGVTLRLADWIGFGLRLDGRYDRHALTGAGGDETDDGWVGDPRIVARAVRPVGSGIVLGGQVNLWFPGAEAPDLQPEATSVEAEAIATLIPEGAPFSLSANAGFRLDNSAETVADPDALSLADRMALGASDSNAVLLGLGATYRIGPNGSVELLGEATWDLLVGGEAPAVSESPLEAAAGVRVGLAATVQLQVVARARLSADPEIAQMSPLVPVAPRFGAMAGLHVQLGGPDRAGGPLVTNSDDEPVAPAAIRGRVIAGGAPIAGALVRLSAGAARREATTDDSGRFRFDAIAGDAGQVTLSVEHEGFEPAAIAVAVIAGETAGRDIELERVLPPGQIRGVIRDFRGKPVPAKVTILPLGKTVTPGAGGVFQVEVPPGDYEVLVEHPGYAPQRREARVDERQVTILNIDLEKP